MKIFAVGIDELTIKRLRRLTFTVSMDAVTGPEELVEFLNYENCEGLLINLEKVGWGYQAVAHLRKEQMRTVIIGLRSGPLWETWSEDRAIFLESGGDDLLADPATARELAASFRAISRRTQGHVQEVHEFVCGFATIIVDLARQLVWVNGVHIQLTPTEMKILATLVLRCDFIQGYERLCRITDTTASDESRIITIRVCGIRKKLGKVHYHARNLIETVNGVGYRIPHKYAITKKNVA